MSKPRLLACPFCGYEPVIVNLPGSVFYKVICDRTSCPMKEVDTGLKDSRAEAIAAWNCRAPARPAGQHGKPGKASRNSKED